MVSALLPFDTRELFVGQTLDGGLDVPHFFKEAGEGDIHAFRIADEAVAFSAKGGAGGSHDDAVIVMTVQGRAMQLGGINDHVILAFFDLSTHLKNHYIQLDDK